MQLASSIYTVSRQLFVHKWFYRFDLNALTTARQNKPFYKFDLNFMLNMKTPFPVICYNTKKWLFSMESCMKGPGKRTSGIIEWMNECHSCTHKPNVQCHTVYYLSSSVYNAVHMQCEVLWTFMAST